MAKKTGPCGRCGEPRSAEAFASPYQSYCRKCVREYGRLRVDHKDREGRQARENTWLKDDGKRRCKRCGEVLSLMVFQGASQFCRPCSSWKRIQQQYRLTQEAYEQMWEKQGRCCKICKTDDPGNTTWTVDHDHACCPRGSGAVTTCGKCVRGILCRGCNNGLGNFRDSPAALREAARYLESLESAGQREV